MQRELVRNRKFREVSVCTTIIDKDIVWYGAVNALGYATEEDNVIKNDGRDWRHFEMPNWLFILVKWVCIIQSIQKSSDPFQYLQYWKEFDTMIAHKIYHWDSKESNPSPLI